MTSADAFLEARDLLLRLRSDQAAALRQFRWPQLDEFNWALDYFDAMARGNEAPALHIVGEDGSEVKRSFRADVRAFVAGGELSARPGRGARRSHPADARQRARPVGGDARRHQARRGADPGDGAAHDRRPARPHRARRGAPCGGGQRAGGEVRGAGRRATRASASARRCAGWQRFEDAASAPAAFTPDGATRATDPLLLYFTSGTTSQPKLVLHTHAELSGRASVDDVLDRPAAGRRAPEHLVARLGQARLELLLRALERRRPASSSTTTAASTRRACSTRWREHGVTSLCAPPTVWRMLIQEDLAAYRGRLNLREVVGAGEPLNPEIIEQVRSRLGPDPARRLRPDRDHRAWSATRRVSAQARLDGPAAARLSRSSCSMPTAARPTRARSASTCRNARSA